MATKHKPDMKALKEHQKLFFTADPQERLNALRLVAGWYEGESAHVRATDPDTAKYLRRAQAIRNLAMSLTTPYHEAYAAVTAMIRQLENAVLPSLVTRPTTLDELLTSFEQVKDQLEAKANKFAARYAALGSFFANYFPRINVKVDKDQDDARQLLPLTVTLSYSSAHADTLLDMLDKPTDLLVQEAPYFTRVAASTVDATGQLRVDMKTLMSAFQDVLARVSSITAPVIQTGVSNPYPTPTGSATAPKTAAPRVPRPATSGNGPFRSGTTMAAIWDVIQNNGQISIDEARALGAADPRRMLGTMSDKLVALGLGRFDKVGATQYTFTK